MIYELGHLALILALTMALAQSVLPLVGAQTGNTAWMALARPSARGQFLFLAIAYGCLTHAFITNDFSVALAANHSNSTLPLIYRITAVWGNHEGSILLWSLILSGWTLAVSIFSRQLDDRMVARVLGVMGLISCGFMLFTLLTSNPFERMFPPPADGNDLNPLLQDPGMVIHPPMLYMGYVGFVVAFAFAVSALLSGRLDAAWARWSRPWTTVAWCFLTCGIALGSFWAYYELGWGGWWFWDPVENASLMPWLAGTALLHSALVMEKREALKIWTVLLSIVTFSLSLLGTFLVRSGVLTSVHSFATDPTRGVFILGILMLFIGGAFALFAWRAPLLKAGGLFAPISREGALVLNNLILTVSTGSVLIGTLYPLVLETLTGEKISVGAPFFNLTFGLLMVPLLIAVPFGPLLAWKRGDLLGALQRLYVVAGLALVAGLVFFYAKNGGPVLAVLGLAAGFFLVFGALADLWYRAGFGKVSASTGWKRLTGLPRSAFGTALGHAGLGITVLGIVAVTTFETENVVEMTQGQTVQAGGFAVKFDGMRATKGPNFTEEQGHFSISRDGVQVADTWSSKRLYTARRMPTTEAGIVSFGTSQLYISLGDPMSNGGIVVRIWWKPYVLLIWGGALVMMAGGFVSLSDRRLRVGAPTRRAKPVKAHAVEAAE